MFAFYVLVGIAAVSLLAWWVWSCRDTGTHDQAPFGEPVFTDDAENRAER